MIGFAGGDGCIGIVCSVCLHVVGIQKKEKCMQLVLERIKKLHHISHSYLQLYTDNFPLGELRFLFDFAGAQIFHRHVAQLNNT